MDGSTETYHIFLIIVAALIILANSYAISLFMRNTSLFSKTNYMLLSLAMSEFITGAVNIPTLVRAQRSNATNPTEAMTLVFTADIMTVFCAAITMMTLCSIIVDRYLIICYPMHYVSIVTKRKIVLVVIACWVLPLLVSFLRLAWLGPLLQASRQDIRNNTVFKELHSRAIENDKYYYIVSSSLFFLIVVLLAALFALMFRSIQRLGRDEREFTTERQNAGSVKREHKAVILFGVMFIAFIVCWTPLVVIRLLASVFPNHYSKMPITAEHVLIVAKYLTSIINPSLYILYKFEFNQEFKRDCQRVKKLICCFIRHGKKGRKDALTEVSYICQSTLNGQTMTYGTEENGHTVQLDSHNGRHVHSPLL